MRPQDLRLIEYGSEFVKTLQLRFPRSRVLWMDASRFASNAFFETHSVGAVISGLPLLNMLTRKVMSILDGAFSYRRPGGSFYQFTYGMSYPVRRPILDRLGLKANAR